MRGDATPPLRGTIHRSLAYSNTTCVRLMEGLRNSDGESRSVGGGCPVSSKGSKNQQVLRMDTSSASIGARKLPARGRTGCLI